MLTELYERLEVLEVAEMISQDISKETKLVIEKIVEEVNPTDEDAFQIFVIHYAMSMQRIENGEVDFEVNEEIIESLKSNEGFEKSVELIDWIKTLSNRTIPKGEQNLLLIHLCNLSSRKEGNQ